MPSSPVTVATCESETICAAISATVPAMKTAIQTTMKANTTSTLTVSPATDGEQWLDLIDISAPWLAHLPQDLLPSVQQAQQPQPSHTQPPPPYGLAARLNAWLSTLSHSVYTGNGQLLCFVPQSELPEGVAYESHIAATGHIPTRDNLHDFFNASIWLTFAKSKALLNRLQAEQIAADGIGRSRGRLRDAITVFDENGAILLSCDDGIACALAAFDWHHCLVAPRLSWANPRTDEHHDQLAQSKCHTDDSHSDGSHSNRSNSNRSQNGNRHAGVTTAVYVFGHALLEQLVTPRKPLCAHTLIVRVSSVWLQRFFALPMSDRMRMLDERLADELAQWLAKPTACPRELSPLPILGVPYFWAANADAQFYEDAFVFRSGRQKKQANN